MRGRVQEGHPLAYVKHHLISSRPTHRLLILLNERREQLDCEDAVCEKCDNVPEIYDEDLFHDAQPTDDLKVLFLPVSDGNIPRWEQIEIFLKHAKATIATGKRVIVHCQAGVGRTGTFLAAYLMDKYRCSAVEAIKKLRRDRPQSLQFDRVDWQTNPFKFSEPFNYQRNYVQERFIELYHEKYIKKTGVGRSAVGEELGETILQLIDREINIKFSFFAENPYRIWTKDTESASCFICDCILSIGPFPIVSGSTTWPVIV
jgi:protein-tyrosine phosphatase